MAKIYETAEDFEKDKLKDQAQQLREQAHSQDRWSWTLLSGSILADLFNVSVQRSSRLLSWLGMGLFIGSMIQMFKSWGTASKAHDLDLQRERLGPETIVLPPEMADTNGKSFTTAIEPKSHMDQVDKSCGCPLKG